MLLIYTACMDEKQFFFFFLQNQRPLVVDVWAPWCGPCRRMEPLFAEMQERYEGRVDVLKVNADESQSLVKQLGVLGIPTTIVYRHGQEIGRRTGAMSRADLQGLFEAALSEDVVRIPAMSRTTRLIRLFIAMALLVMGITIAESGAVFYVFALLMLFWAMYDHIPGVSGLRDKLIKKLLQMSNE